MTAQEYYNDIPVGMARELAVRLAKLSLPAWEKFAKEDNLIFTDNAEGNIHKIDRNVLKDTLKEIEDYITLSRDNDYSLDNGELIKVYANFEELVRALQEGDWEIQVQIEYTFYCINEILKELTGEQETGDTRDAFHNSVTKAIETLESIGAVSEKQILVMLEEIKYSYIE